MVLAVSFLAGVPSSSGPEAADVVVALGRISPKDGIVKVAGPSEPVLVVADVLVQTGDRVKAGAVIARLDDYAERAAAVQQLKAMLAASEANIVGIKAELDNAQSEGARYEDLFAQGLVSATERDKWRTRVEVERSRIKAAQAEREVRVADLHNAEILLERRAIRAPITGQVLRVHVRPGEKVGGAGIVDLARTDQMYAIAEVYESDVQRVRVGQRAQVISRALPAPLEGTVERIGLMIGKKDIFGDDPTARKDARVVEVEIRLDDGRPAAAFTNLQVEVRIGH
jgi:HlyD family secretion protein